MAVGDYVQRHDHIHAGAGKPISPHTKAHVLMTTRMFFRDCQEWEWIPRRFDPNRALAVPPFSVNALIADEGGPSCYGPGSTLRLPGCCWPRRCRPR